MSEKSQSSPRAREFFTAVRGKRCDAELHGSILDDGDHEDAVDVSRAVMKRLGHDDERIERLLGKKKAAAAEE